MSKAEQIIGRLTVEETEQVFREAAFALPEERLIAVLSAVLTPEQAEGPRCRFSVGERPHARVDRDIQTRIRQGRPRVPVGVFGDVALWPYEYVILDADWIIKAWDAGALTFHPTNLSEAQLSDQIYYCRSRGIGLADAVVICLGAISGPVGWFDADPTVVNYVAMFQDIGVLTATNHKRRAASRRRSGRASRSAS